MSTRTPCMLGQARQEVIPPQRQANRHSVVDHKSLDDIEKQSIDGTAGFAPLAPQTVAQRRADAGREFANTKGLLDVVIAPR